jgi:hypothetical protein
MDEKYHVLGGISGELFPVKIGKYYGFINYRGALVIPAKYDSAQPFNDGLAAVSINGEYGFIDNKGKTIIPFVYQDAGVYSEGYIAVKKYDGWGYINGKGKTLIEFIYQDAHEFSEGLAAVKSDGKYFFINGDANVAIAERYSWAGSFKGGIALVEIDNPYAFISSGGKILLDKIDFNLVKEYRLAYPYSITNLLELYEGIRYGKKIQGSPEALILIQEARLQKGFIAEMANLLEITIRQKNDSIYNRKFEAAAILRSAEVSLTAEIKKLLKR